MKKSLLIWFVSTILLSACNKVSRDTTVAQNSDQPNVKTEDTDKVSGRSKPVVMKLTSHQVMDTEGTGMIASTYLLPAEWHVQDKLFWEYRDPTVPIRYQSLLKNADGTMSIQIYPDVRSSWTTGPSGTSGYRPPSDIISGLKEVVKAERKGKNISYTQQKILSNDSRNIMQARQNVQTGVITIEYEENGTLYEEEFYGKLDVSVANTPTVMGNMQSIIWAGSNLYSCKAVKGKLEECRKIAQTVASSARITKPFYNKLSQVIQILSDQTYQRIYQAGQISKIISQTNDQMIANIDASYRESQQSADRTNAQFSDYMRGVDRYSDAGTEVQLPSGYTNAWVNDRGEYILTNTSGYDPGRDFEGNWKSLQRNQ